MMACAWPVLLCLLLVRNSLADYDWDDWTELDEYVWADDGAYSYTYLATYEYEGVTVYMYNMTSQFYLDETKVDHWLWWHFMGIAVPDNRRFDDAGYVILVGGSNDDYDDYPPEDSAENLAVAKFSNDTGLIGCYVGQVINGPIVYYNDPERRGLSGDPQIAWTFRTYIDTPEWGGPQVLSRFSMTKAAKTGVDTLINVVRDQEGLELTRFVNTGPSKWGWTCWSHLATDNRLVGGVPMVFSLINGNAAAQAHYQALDGGWSFVMEPYWEENLTQEIPYWQEAGLYEYEDMYMYRRRFTMPTYSISATGDEYFFPQDFHVWWDDFPDPKWVWMVPNAEHVLFPHWREVFENLMGFWLGVLEGFEFPTITWERHDHPDAGEIIMYSDQAPKSVRAMRAVTLQNDTKRDFRLFAGNPATLHPVWWRERPVQDLGNNSWRHLTDKYEDEWVGHLIEATFQGPDDLDLIFSTEVNIVPDTFPTEPCTTREECWGTLV